MTIPYLQNCSHSKKGWCLDCVRNLGEQNDRMWKVLKLLTELEWTSGLLKSPQDHEKLKTVVTKAERELKQT